MQFRGFQLDKYYFLKTKTYTTHSKIIEKQLIYFERADEIIENERKIDCFATHWLVCVAREVPQGVFIRSGSGFIELKNYDVLFLPAFSILEWFFKISDLVKWSGYISPLQLPSEIHNKTFLLRNTKGITFSSLNEIVNFLIKQQSQTQKIYIQEQRLPSDIALAIKNEIDKNYTLDQGLKVIVSRLGISRMTFSGAFKKSYGMTPIQYQHRLRIFESLRLINLGYSITEALFAVGFSDPGQYIDHFKSLLDVNPKQYVPKNMNMKDYTQKLDAHPLQNSK